MLVAFYAVKVNVVRLRSGVVIVIDVEGLRLDLAGIHPLIAISAFVTAHFPHYSMKVRRFGLLGLR